MVAAKGDLLEGKRISERFRIKSVEKWTEQVVLCLAEDLAEKDVVFLILIESVAIANLAGLKKELEQRAKIKHKNLSEIISFGDTTDGDFFIATKRFGKTYLSEHLGRANSLKVAEITISQIIEAEQVRRKAGLSYLLPLPQKITVEDFGKNSVVFKLMNLDLTVLQDSACEIGVAMNAKDMASYQAPELMKSTEVEETAVVYALACLFHQIITGRLPFESDDIVELQSQHMCMEPPRLHELRPDLYFPPEIELFLRKALSKEPEKRYANLALFKSAIADAVASRKSKIGLMKRVGKVAAALGLAATGFMVYSAMSVAPSSHETVAVPTPTTNSSFATLPALPPDAIKLGAIHLRGNESKELRAGDYVCNSLVLEGNSHLFAKDNVRLWLSPETSFDGEFSLKDNAVLESCDTTAEFCIYDLSSSNITMEGHSRIKARIDAPASLLSAKGDAFIEGPVSTNGQILAQNAHFKHIVDE